MWEENEKAPNDAARVALALVAVLGAAPRVALADAETKYAVVVKNGDAELQRFEGISSFPATCIFVNSDKTHLDNFSGFNSANGDGTVVSQGITVESGVLTFGVNCVGDGSITGKYSRDGQPTAFTFTVSCTVPVTGLGLSPSPVTLRVGEKEKLTATISPDNATNK